MTPEKTDLQTLKQANLEELENLLNNEIKTQLAEGTITPDQVTQLIAAALQPERAQNNFSLD